MPLEAFSLCDACNRHIKRSSVRCPFCAAAVSAHRGSANAQEWRWTGATRATLVAAALAGCERATPAPAPIVRSHAQQVPTPIVVEPSAPDASDNGAQLVADASLAPAMFGLAYGAPPPEVRDGAPPRGQVTMTDVDSESPQSGNREALVTRVVRRQITALRACYERGLRINPTLTGSVSIRFDVSAEGRVTEARATGLESDPSVGACVASRVRGLVFPSGTSASEVFVVGLRFEPAP